MTNGEFRKLKKFYSGQDDCYVFAAIKNTLCRSVIIGNQYMPVLCALSALIDKLATGTGQTRDKIIADLLEYPFPLITVCDKEAEVKELGHEDS